MWMAPATTVTVITDRVSRPPVDMAPPPLTCQMLSYVVVANTATTWNGVHWTMIMWGSICERSVPRRRLMLHECFHRIQDEAGLPAGANDNAHLDSLDGRYWFLLELRALAVALRSEDR